MAQWVQHSPPRETLVACARARTRWHRENSKRACLRLLRFKKAKKRLPKFNEKKSPMFWAVLRKDGPWKNKQETKNGPPKKTAPGKNMCTRAKTDETQTQNTKLTFFGRDEEERKKSSPLFSQVGPAYSKIKEKRKNTKLTCFGRRGGGEAPPRPFIFVSSEAWAPRLLPSLPPLPSSKKKTDGGTDIFLGKEVRRGSNHKDSSPWCREGVVQEEKHNTQHKRRKEETNRTFTGSLG